MLKEFFVRYINILYGAKFRDQIAEIRVEGHTSSEWAEGATEIQRYIWNLDLSQRRAFEILRICLPSIPDLKILEQVKGQAIATGHSSSKIVLNAPRWSSCQQGASRWVPACRSKHLQAQPVCRQTGRHGRARSTKFRCQALRRGDTL